MAVAIAEVAGMSRYARILERTCPMCEQLGIQSGMLKDNPKWDHWYCSTCRHVEVEWKPIYRRVKAVLLWEYRSAKSRLAVLPAAAAMRYDTPYVDGGQVMSQQEAHLEREARDHWVASVVESTFKYSLTQQQKNVIVSLYFERYSYRVTAERLQIAKSTVETREEEALRAFARTAQWA